MSDDKTLSVFIDRAEKLCGKNRRNGEMLSSAYCIVNVLGTDGSPTSAAKERKTGVVKDSLDPTWQETFKIEVPKASCGGVKIELWDKHRVRSDKFLGQVILKFDSSLMDSQDVIDDWFKLDKRGKNESVSGRIKFRIQYGTLKTSSSTTTTTTTAVTSSTTTTTTTSSKVEKKESKKATTPKKAHSHKSATSSAATTTSTPTVTVVSEEKTPRKKGDKKEKPAAGWNNNNAGLAGSRWVRIKEIKATDPYPFPREGPHNVSMTSFVGNVNITKNVIAGTGYSISVARADVRVRGNKWYFEVTTRDTGSNVYVGWISNLYTNWGDKTGWFMSSDGKKWQGKNSTDSQASWSAGDIIGCALDLVTGEINYTKNGVRFPGKFGFDMVRRDVDVGENFYPAIAVQGYSAKVEVNFGDTPLQCLLTSHFPLHFVLPTIDQDKTRDMFDVYKKAGQTEGEEDDDEDIINFNGTFKLAKDLDIDPMEDIGLFLIAWKLNCVTAWEFTKEEWMVGWSVAGCTSIEEIAKAVKRWKEEVEDPAAYAIFYAFCIEYLKEGKKVLAVTDALGAWNVVLKPRNWPLYDDWVEFVTVTEVKAVNPDTWNMLWKFVCEFSKDMSNYNEGDCWPYIFDEFHEWYEEKHA